MCFSVSFRPFAKKVFYFQPELRPYAPGGGNIAGKSHRRHTFPHSLRVEIVLTTCNDQPRTPQFFFLREREVEKVEGGKKDKLSEIGHGQVPFMGPDAPAAARRWPTS